MRTLHACLAALAVASAAPLAAFGCSTSSSPTFQAHDDCPRSLAQYCGSAKCTLDWATAREEAVACAPNTSTTHFFAEGCEGFNVLTTTNEDVGTHFYYGASDGKLVAIVDFSANFGGSESCVAANAARFTPPSCPLVKLPCQTDGGDGGDGSDGSDGSPDASSHD